jgi:hypothetical protein
MPHPPCTLSQGKGKIEKTGMMRAKLASSLFFRILQSLKGFENLSGRERYPRLPS